MNCCCAFYVIIFLQTWSFEFEQFFLISQTLITNHKFLIVFYLIIKSTFFFKKKKIHIKNLLQQIEN